MINKVKLLSHLKPVLLKLQERGVPLISAMESDNFVKYGKSICHAIEDVPDDVIKCQHRKFLEKLEQTYSNIPQEKLNKLTDMDIIKKSLNSLHKIHYIRTMN